MAEDKTTPIYNIKAAVKLTDVPACTLRSWESRYGIIKPARHPNGYRLYSEQDITSIIWLRDRLQEGLSIAQASALLERARAEQGGVMQPKPVAEKLLKQPSQEVRSLQHLQHDLLDAFMHYDEGRAERVINEAFSLYPVDQVCLRLFEPLMYDIGELWADGKILVQAEHFATNILRTRLGGFMHANLSSNGYLSNRPLIVTGCAPGEAHELGALMVSLFLRRLNYRVIYLGQNVPDDRVQTMLQELAPALVCFSASTRETAAALHRIERKVAELQRQENLTTVFGFGGRIFNEDEDLRNSFEGIYLGDDAAAAAHIIHDLLG